MGERFHNIVIASDMDGTFLTDRVEGNRRNRERIAYFKEQGGKFTFSTGRSFQQILTSVPDAASLVNIPAVTCNGACLYDFSAEKELEYYAIPHDVVAELEDFVNRQGENIGLRGGTSDIFLYNLLNNPYIQSDYHLWGTENCRLLPMAQWKSYSICKVAVRAEASVLAQLRPLLTKQFEGRLEITQSDPTLIDIQAAGRTKAALLKELLPKVGKSPYLCVVGDYDNDLEMMSLADLPCCPSNAVDCVKAVAKHCFCSNHEGVIADVIDYLDQTV